MATVANRLSGDCPQEALTMLDVQGWFRDAIPSGSDYIVPDREHLMGLTHFLNIGPVPCKTAIPPQQALGRLQLSEALRTLSRLLPGMVLDWERQCPDGMVRNTIQTGGERAINAHALRRLDEKRRLNALALAVDQASISFRSFPKPATQAALNTSWHTTALSIQRFVRLAFESTGQNRINFSKHDGPGVKIVQRALCHLEGEPRKGTAIVAALQSKGR